MSQRFYFDLTNDDDHMRDEEGVVASGPDEAIEEAQAALEDMLCDAGAFVLADSWQMVIRDGSGVMLKAIALDEGAVD